MMVNAFLLLGGNLGDRVATLTQARHALAAAGHIVKVSAFYQTAAWGKTDQPDFINQAIQIETELSGQALLELCLAVEKQLGRERLERWGARTIDIDIILYGDEVIDTPDLQVPHPRMAIRRFVLVPMVEIAGDVVDPRTGKNMGMLLEVCEDGLEVRKIQL